MLALYKRLLDRIGVVEQSIGIGLIVLIVTAITVQVFTRYALGRPLAWVEESATYAFIWMVFVGASLGLKLSRHIVIESFVKFLPPRASAALRLVIWVLVLITLSLVVFHGQKVMGVEGRSKTISLPVALPRSWFYSLPLTLSAFSMALTTLYLLFCELAFLFGRRPPPRPGSEAIA